MTLAAPSRYNPETIAALVAAKRAGKSTTDACATAGISRVTYYAWLVEHPELRDAMKQAEAAHRAEWREQERRALGLTCPIAV